jgi:hypothetical protein
MATKPLELSSLEGLRGGRDSGAIVVFVFGLGSPSRSLPGRQRSPAKCALRATRGAFARSRGHEVHTVSHQSTMEILVRIVLCTFQSQRSSSAASRYLTYP